MIGADFKWTSRLKEWWGGTEQEEAYTEPSVLRKLAALFHEEKVPYRLIHHPDVFTAPELAGSIRAPGKEVAKVVIVRAEDKYIMAVLPANCPLDVNRFARMIGARNLAVAEEWELEKLFPDCHLGAMPPFGNLYGIPVYIDATLAKQSVIFFPAGSHHATLEMNYDDFDRLVSPLVGHFAFEPLKKASGE